MAEEPFPETLKDRMRWAIQESILIAGIFLFWMVVGLLLLVVLGLIAVLIRTFQIEQLRFVYRFVREDSAVWAAVMPLATATISLYVLVRAGTILIDRYRGSTGR